jgi:NAD(P)-dependent dehydrogenase (short-subunit alcohol dehydrogenase family)
MSNQDRKGIFITGSFSGLGRATAKLFATHPKEFGELQMPDDA